jgi:hypothetical protein
MDYKFFREEMMKVAKLYSVRSSEDKKKPFESVCGFVEESETEFHFKSASLKLVVSGEEFQVVNSQSGVPTVNTGEKVILHLARAKKHRKYILAMQVYRNDIIGPVIRARFLFDDYIKFR